MASQEWKTLLIDEPDNELIRFSYAKALMEEHQWPLAAEQFARLVSDQPEYALAWGFLARCRLEAGDRAGAAEACELGRPVALRQKHEIPLEEIESVMSELNSDY